MPLPVQAVEVGRFGHGTVIGMLVSFALYTLEDTNSKAQPREGDNQARGFSCLHTDTRNDPQARRARFHF